VEEGYFVDRERAAGFQEVAIVSCDLVGHSGSADWDQIRRVAAINMIVAAAMDRREAGRVVWSSGGDGGHVLFFGNEWQDDAILLIEELCAWAREDGTKLRITGHVGMVATLSGADRRTQTVGSGINFSGWLVRKATGHGVVVSDSFRLSVTSVKSSGEITFHSERLWVDRSDIKQLLWLMSFGDVTSKWGNGEQDDYLSLDGCLERGEGWDALYFAKRISQINATDDAVAGALGRVSRILNSESMEKSNFLSMLRADELTEMLKLGHLVERRPGEMICRVDDPGKSMFIILRGEVGVYNLEGKGFDGSAEPKHVHRAGEIVGELAPALRRTRTADLVAMTNVALLSFINDEIKDKLSVTEAGVYALRQYDKFILDRVLQHTLQVAPYLFGQNHRGPLSAAPWEDTMRKLLPHAELITVDTPGVAVEIDQVVENVTSEDPRRGLFILVSGSVMSSRGNVMLSGAQCPLLWFDVSKLGKRQPSTYQLEAEPILVLWIGVKGIEQLTVEQRRNVLPELEGAVGGVPSEYEYDVYLCHSSEDKPVVLEIKDRLWNEYGIRSWYDDEELLPGDSTRRSIEIGLKTSRFLLLCASANLKDSEWANREIDSITHLDVKRRDGEPKVLVLKLYEQESNDEAVPDIFRGTKRHDYRRNDDFEKLSKYIASHR
jgi:TIR domain/Cyclic nucleotide-binding domain